MTNLWAKRQTAEVDSQAPRFLTLDQVADELNISKWQTTALLRRKAIRALKMGAGRGQWRIERSKPETC